MEDAPLVREKNECRKRQAVIDLCRKYGVLNKLTTLQSSHYKIKLP